VRISPESIEGLTADELIGFVVSNRYKPENYGLLQSSDFARLPDYVKHLIFILQFETEYEMQGILTLLQNTSGQYLYQTIDSFAQTDNNGIARCLAEVAELLTSHGLTVADLRKSYQGVNPYDVVAAGVVGQDEELTEQIAGVDEQLRPLMEEKGFWTNVENKIKDKR
jgi:hypothetical protein